MSWWNEYVGIQYKAKGRDREGLDCWGLVRLVYLEKFDTLLPSFAEVYEQKEHEKQAELIAMHKEGWEKTSHPATGDVVLFRINGSESHVGIVTNPSYFLHVREGQDAVIEKLDSVIWKHRIVGFYKYREGNKPLIITAKPDPLKTIRIDTQLPTGVTVRQMADLIRDNNGVSKVLDDHALILIDGIAVPKDQWEVTVPKAGSVVEYRAVALGGGGGLGSIIGTLAVFVAVVAFQQYYLAPTLVGAGFATTVAGVTTLSAAGIGISVAAGLALSFAGSLLVNAIFPIRPPQQGQVSSGSIGTPIPMNMLNGGQNQYSPYSPIPVVLGKVRWTPPVGAKAYKEVIGKQSFLRMLLVWGYGQIQVSDLRIGETPIASFKDCEVATIIGNNTEDKTDFNRIYGRDVDQKNIDVTLLGPDETSGGTVVETILNECDSINVNLYFPEGLRAVVVDGRNAGYVGWAGFNAQIAVRQLNPITLAPLSGYADVQRIIAEYKFALKPAWFNVDNDEELEPVYQWTRISVDSFNKVIVRRGAFTTSKGANPTGNLLIRLQQDTFGLNTTFTRLPDYGVGEESLYDIVVYGNEINEVIDRRGATGGKAVTGCDLTYTDLNVTIASGLVDRAESESLVIGYNGYPYAKMKDAFSINVSFPVTRGVYQVYVRRGSPSFPDYYDAGSQGNVKRLATCVLQTVTGFLNARPVTPPKPLAMTAIRIKSSNQLNGNLEGITATCISICKDYDRTTSPVSWIERPTRNPASLFRYVLQHPANVKAVADAQLDLPALQAWHDYCRTNKFMFDAVVTGQESLLDVLRDIAAAGRASPAIKDGKWTIIIDKPRASYAQYFTPHNSWGFEAVRSLPVMPHGFRVQFANSEKAYEPDEMIVYNDGYTSANATRLEGLTLRGVTTKDAIFKHARFHLAQLKLRPEIYTINADIEHIVCNRGDLVKVTHDVPMWGLGSGRISERLTSTKLKLSEAMPMDAGVQYTIRIRLENGTSITRTVVAKGSDGFYDEIDLTSSVTTTQAAQENLFLFGALAEESVDLVVLSIEPMDNMAARITLADYSPAIYDSDDEPIPAFDSQITLPPMLEQPRILFKPTISTIVSDERAMVRLAPSKYEYQIRVNFRNPENLPEQVKYVEGQIDSINDDDLSWITVPTVSVDDRTIYFKEVQEGDQYRIRIRYVDEVGRVGAWSTITNHTVVGRTTLPKQVSTFTATPQDSKIRLSWTPNAEVDIVAYEIRTANSDWGSTTVQPLYKGSATFCLVDPVAIGSTATFFIKAIDDLNLYSTTARQASLLMSAVPNISTINYIFADTSLTNATITLSWADVAPQFGLSNYIVSDGLTTQTVKANTITLPANWIGNRTFTVTTVDNLGNQSTGRTRAITKLAPNNPTTGSAKVSNGVLTLDWNDATPTTLPVWGYEVREDLSFGSAGFVFKGTASACVIPKELIAIGTNPFYIKTIDTDNNYSTNYLTINHQYQTIPNISSATYTYADTALTSATITIKWNAVTTQYGTDYYEIEYNSTTTTVKGTQITLEANFTGDRSFVIKTVDINGNKSSGYTLNATLVVPNSANNYRASVIDNNVMLYWTLPTKTSLPIRHALIKKGATWATAVLVGEKSGEFTTINEPQGGTFTYWIAMVDTDGNESTPISLTAKVSEPPDFIFYGSQDSTFTGTLTSAYLENNTVIIPINTTESWEDHFTARSPAWATIQDQIDAGYPIYIQPADLDGNYQEVFDFGTILASSRVTVSVGGETVAGTPTVSVNIDTSDDNITWNTNEGTTEIFATQFRYVRVTVRVTGDDLSLYKLESLNCRADAKQQTDSGKVSAVSTDASGTIVNFNKSFIDVESITATAGSTSANIVVYDFNDNLLSGTYSVTSNVITVNVTSHGFIAGQKVRLGFISGTATTGIVTIATASTNSFTANLTTADTSGNVSVYPESFRVYVFNTSGTRVNSTVSWNARGY